MKKITIVLSFAILMILAIVGKVEANVQSRPNTNSLVNQTVSSFFTLIRQIESPGQALALNASIDGTGKETSGSNNLDAHMIKNTEYGGVVMLAASSYGTCPNGSASGASDNTTGNKYGVYQISSGYEYVAGLHVDGNNSYITNLKNASKRYYNYYSNGYVPGDATTETANWKGASYASFVGSSYPVFFRSDGGAFGFSSGTGGANGNGGSRVAVAVGAGL